MKIRILCLALTALILSALISGCGCKHEWQDADCTTPKTCTLCNETEGEAARHKWLDATCTAPKSCKNCDENDGDPLGHEWVEATTEAPTTCTRCKVTEGSKLNTDPRFTTESTKQFYGKWTCEVTFPARMFGESDTIEDIPAILHIEFGKLGEFICNVELVDQEAFINMMKNYSREMLYQTLSLEGFTQEEADEAMLYTYGMTVDEYINESFDSLDLDDLFGAFSQDFVYYVGQNGIYYSDSWYGEFESSEYTFDGDTLIIDEITIEEGDEKPLVWTKDE